MIDFSVPRGHSKTDSRNYSLQNDKPDLKLSEHFRLIEFACRDGSDEVLVHPALVLLLEAIRAAAGGKTVHINSGYRTSKHNQAVDGAKDSRHVMGMAADITIRGLSQSQVYAIAEHLNPGGLGRYDSFTHVDVEGNGRRWDGP